MMYRRPLAWTLAALLLCCCQPAATQERKPKEKPPMNASPKLEKATFGAGCFWCSEAVLLRLRGVKSVVSGYSGGRIPNPTYKQVCSGLTGHAEVVQITYDPAVVSYKKLLEDFLADARSDHAQPAGRRRRHAIPLGDLLPQRPSRSGWPSTTSSGSAGVGAVQGSGGHRDRRVPRRSTAAEAYHQDYYDRNRRQPYCQTVVKPKVEKFEKLFHDKLKPQAKNQ